MDSKYPQHREGRQRDEGLELLNKLTQREAEERKQMAHKNREQSRNIVGAISRKHGVYWGVTHARHDKRTGPTKVAPWSMYAEYLYEAAVPWK